MITGAPWPTPTEVTVRVLGIQAKLHRWASEDPARRFDDLFNLVVDPAVLLMAWRRVRSNRGARTAGVDGSTAHYIEAVRGVESFLAELRADLVAQQFVPLPAWERLIPKSGGRVRRLGIRISRPQRSKSSMSGRTSRRRAGHGRINSTIAVLLHGCENEVALPVAFVKFPCGARPVLDRMRFRFSARVHSRWAQSVKDLPYGAPMLVRWDKRRFACDQVECPRRTFTEVTDQLGRRLLTLRLRQRLERAVSRGPRSVADVAREYAVSWWSANQALIDRAADVLGPARAGVRLLGVDETRV